MTLWEINKQKQINILRKELITLVRKSNKSFITISKIVTLESKIRAISACPQFYDATEIYRPVPSVVNVFNEVENLSLEI